MFTRKSLKSFLCEAAFLVFSLLTWLGCVAYCIKPAHQSFSPKSLEIAKHFNTKETVTFTHLIIFTSVVSIVYMIAFALTSRSKIASFWICIVAFIFGFGIDQSITVLLKYSVGRLRPDFLERCKINVTEYRNMVSKQISEYGIETTADYPCTGKEKDIHEGRLSFPSGHSSTSGFAAWYCTVLCFIRSMLYCKKLKNEKRKRNQPLLDPSNHIPSYSINQVLEEEQVHSSSAPMTTAVDVSVGQNESQNTYHQPPITKNDSNVISVDVSSNPVNAAKGTTFVSVDDTTPSSINQSYSFDAYSSSSSNGSYEELDFAPLITPLCVYVIGTLLSLIPILLSLWIAASRVSDHWHHPSDAIFGWILGLVSGVMCFPLIWTKEKQFEKDFLIQETLKMRRGKKE
ncbi:phosphatidate phosphatase [Monocercomonoides exilis]|uniref:phosphatidate phosphatase n=1 Tax=Monocercomonoides exilis TaxID=2049356 RepID=UPI003559A0EB|nr:phosphatidate phosphatase [Monocercomonoides exilis]|eukprot:MONOS_319.1-p1 / transcript=MONOS_319.1 / gene=MONOS_319 / organism=Monocercomonoides_exilis_PA203 / gene_product=phosphatidate phosphatase [EC:3.1.3.4] / transcript_product=phosphatidate phosphatase [EC:3.1.3.4] / location=Mono_scaffold00005:139805-141130(-) / protein_length=401 / sequence_SO=supercontig / SO=protein_coding / is_pseudo=false